jgi:phosphoenolpyruvate carboxykinase (ATP)
MDFTKNLILIGGTGYGGEVKKSIFTVMNYLLPQKGVLPMHCSANIGKDGSSAIFFDSRAPGRQRSPPTPNVNSWETTSTGGAKMEFSTSREDATPR